MVLVWPEFVVPLVIVNVGGEARGNFGSGFPFFVEDGNFMVTGRIVVMVSAVLPLSFLVHLFPSIRGLVLAVTGGILQYFGEWITRCVLRE